MIRGLMIALTVAACTPALSKEPASPRDWVHLAVDHLCGPQPVSGLAAQQALRGAWFLDEQREERGRQMLRLTQRFALPGGGELRVRQVRFRGQVRRFTAAVYKENGSELHPHLLGMADGRCRLHAGRRIVRKAPANTVLEQLASDLETVKWTETLEAPWPDGTDPGGPRVALVDSGLAYDLPLFRDRLARGDDGKPLGYDFWDQDPWPYDGDTSRGVFFPIRHGTAVASVLVREAPSAALIPFRYPRPDMSRMRTLLERAAQAGARVIAMPLGSRKPEDWTAFAKAMRGHPGLLAIVSAGNNGRNIDDDPLWPGVLTLDNMIVVTSSDGFGRLARGSNWGPQSVDIMLPAENVPVVDFRGASGTASGSSYAVPRLAALAARLLAEAPNLTTDQLKARIFARAKPSPYEDEVVAVGWIADPAE
ncbi:S8 family peptidase [Dichotomicrobium thermohalophilum]|uniref:Subtilase family protein n=1 Tax=Dichotomicrobium thermohalophilum TaxID=933063 RepID=A0A397QAL3_9HYPH|nr:S8 family serine peptidase [Dichotomicrobium thermohalophilum]RIA56855.1 subtilase family protein [Dichotomicrobium thermohalophilum]